MTESNTGEKKSTIVFPTEKTLLQAFKLSLRLTKPICTYFYVDSLKGKCCIINDGDETILYKNDEEHTSPILKLYELDRTYIIITNNIIYLVDKRTEIKKNNLNEASVE